ncbi:MAG TPA: N-acetylglutaminylglutamine amidotransferase, partial [Solirubrobacteraceae bacterium]|nr:N-acetylglutaminylglutamine amidotransferase [Solirubrobacteraceae bacterium]
MCGFAGELARSGSPDGAAVGRMTEILAPRGPDGQGSWSQGRLALGHRRLKVIDLSENGAQPMVDEALDLVIAYNGCIYNYPALRAELEGDGYRFFSTSDTEVILKSYHRWGKHFVDHLKGMFAFCLAERTTGKVVLARDRLGIKPLYLSETPDRLRFASTLPALLAGGGVDTTLDRTALHHYLTWHSVVPAPRTILRGVRKLAPATVLIIEPDGRRESWEFWNPPFARSPERGTWDEAEWRDGVLVAMREAIGRRMVGDVPVGVLLSGGLDSSLIVGLLAEAGQRHLATFSVGFPAVGGKEGDEFRYSDVIARRYDTDHHRIEIADERLLPAVKESITAMSEPMISHDVVAFYLLSEQVSKHVKVVQSGQGADEVFAGYSWYQPLADADTDADGDADRDGLDAYAAEFFDRPHEEMAEMLAPDYRIGTDASRDFAHGHFAAGGSEGPLDRALRLDTRVMLIDDPVKRVDNMTMAWGLEARTPFLDHELVELAATCPPELKLSHGGKGILKIAARTILPDEIIDR